MKTLTALVKRNVKLFFKDKGMFFTSLITPAILLVLYSTFLGNVYRDSFLSSLPDGFSLDEDIINGLIGGELISSILAISAVTVSFCSNMLMVQDKVNGSVKDLTISPVKPQTLSFAYYIANLVSTLMILYTASALCFVYVAFTGWCMTFSDVLLTLLDVTLAVLFGGALSSVINFFLSSQGQISAVGTIISSGYGFICGGYMPISSFSAGLQKVISFLPGTYATALIRNHAMRGALDKMQSSGVPSELMKGIKDSIDVNLNFFDRPVSVAAMYAVIVVTIVALLSLYVLINILSFKRKR